MAQIKVILVALDLEAGSRAVLARAMQLARAHAARLVVIHVIEAEPLAQIAALSERSEADLRDEFGREARATVEAMVFENGDARHKDVWIEFGAPHEVVTHLAGERHADLIVIGPGKGRSLKEKVLGSTADRVIRAAAVPVLVVRRDSAEPYRQILVAVDFSAQSAAAMKEARGLAPEATLQVLHAVEIPLAFAQALLRAGTSQPEIEQYRTTRADTARAELAAFVDEAAGAGRIDIRVVDGEAGAALVRLSKSGRIDLIAMGPHGRGVMRQALLGSVTQRVLREAACDVLVGVAAP